MPVDHSVRVDAHSLMEFATAIFVAKGVPADEAGQVAGSLVESNLCGHESHGVVRVTEYLDLLECGELHTEVSLDVITETAGLLACDANLGFGQVQMRRLIDRLEPMVCEAGVACATVRNCGHVGRLAEWVEEVARRGLASFLTVNDNGVLRCVAPPGGSEPCISTNPIAIGVPAIGEPMVVDVSTSVVANGKIRVAQISGEAAPDGWLLDADGRPTNDPNTRFGEVPGSILPMGGYKGFGLGLFFDMLVGGLSGGHCPPAPDGTVECNNVLLIAFDPERFHGLDAFQAEAKRLTDSIRASRRQEGVEKIRLPGDRSQQTRSERLRDGVPLDRGTWSELCRAGQALGVAAPPV